MLFKNKFLLLFFLLSIGISISGISQTKIDSLQTELKKTVNKKEKLKTLNALTKQMIRKNHKKLIPNLKAYISLAKELKEYDLLASKSRFLIQQYLFQGKNDEAYKLCDSILSFKSKFKLKKSEAHILLKKGGIDFAELKFKNAVSNYKKSAKLFLQSKDSIFAADAYFFSGQAYNNSGDFVKAITQLETAYILYEKLKDYNYMFSVANELRLILRRNGLKQKANEELIKDIQKAKKYNVYGSLYLMYARTVEQLLSDKKGEEAKVFLDSMHALSPKIKDIGVKKREEIVYDIFMLQYSLLKKDTKNADKYYLEYEKKTQKFKQRSFLSHFHNLKTKYLISKKEYSKALKGLLQYRKEVNYGDANSFYYLESEKLLSELYEKFKDFENSTFHKNNYLRLKDSIHNNAITNSYTYHQSRLETAQKEKKIIKQDAEIHQLETENKLASSKRNTLIALLFSLLLITLGIWLRGKIKKEQLKREIEKNKEELNNFTHQLLLKRKEQEELEQQFEKLKESLKEKESINSIQELIASKILTKDDWYNFKEKFTKVHPSFFNEIRNKGYSLTKSEERLVALEKLKLDNNEIAKILGVSLDSVFISRYRLRKKINAPKEIPLLEFLS
jgi:hypothetical protein